LLFAAGAGISVMMRAKKIKPKSRVFITSRSERMLEEIRREFAPGIDEDGKKKFEAAYGLVVREMEKPDSPDRAELTVIAQELAAIRKDKNITPGEAEKWIASVNDIGLEPDGGATRGDQP